MAKEIRKTIRFSNEEYSKIEELMSEHKLTFAEFARGAILRKKIKTNLTKDLLFEINRVGNNLNQIAKKVNSGSDRKNLLIELIQIRKELEAIKNVC